MSLIRASNESAELFTVGQILALLRRKLRCRAASSVMPMTPFMGVRISWLMFARNSLLARLAASAASLARLQLRLDLPSRGDVDGDPEDAAAPALDEDRHLGCLVATVSGRRW